MWEAVQLEIERRRAFAEKYGLYKLDYATDERLRRIIWRCNKKYSIKGEKSCENKDYRKCRADKRI